MTKYWHRLGDPVGRQRCIRFEQWERAHPEYEFFRPSPMNDPWHVKTIVNGVHVNIYPHKMSIYVAEYGKKYPEGTTLETLQKILLALHQGAEDDDSFELIEK